LYTRKQSPVLRKLPFRNSLALSCGTGIQNIECIVDGSPNLGR